MGCLDSGTMAAAASRSALICPGTAIALVPAGGEVLTVVTRQDEQPPGGVDADRGRKQQSGEVAVVEGRQRGQDPVHRDFPGPGAPLGVSPPSHWPDATGHWQAGGSRQDSHARIQVR